MKTCSFATVVGVLEANLTLPLSQVISWLLNCQCRLLSLLVLGPNTVIVHLRL